MLTLLDPSLTLAIKDPTLRELVARRFDEISNSVMQKAVNDPKSRLS